MTRRPARRRSTDGAAVRPANTPAYFLGRSAETWMVATNRRSSYSHNT